MSNSWKTYLPEYRLPRFLQYCFGCLALFMIVLAIVIFLGLPMIFSYINSLDTARVLDEAVTSTRIISVLSDIVQPSISKIQPNFLETHSEISHY